MQCQCWHAVPALAPVPVPPAPTRDSLVKPQAVCAGQAHGWVGGGRTSPHSNIFAMNAKGVKISSTARTARTHEVHSVSPAPGAHPRSRRTMGSSELRAGGACSMGPRVLTLWQCALNATAGGAAHR